MAEQKTTHGYLLKAQLDEQPSNSHF
jgi:hypothetical protein